MSAYDNMMLKLALGLVDPGKVQACWPHRPGQRGLGRRTSPWA
ncbi:MAG: hypothetical protein ACLSVD_06125 [Eggerthellaceae bacterium]